MYNPSEAVIIFKINFYYRFNLSGSNSNRTSNRFYRYVITLKVKCQMLHCRQMYNGFVD